MEHYGAKVTGINKTAFRVWAPLARQVDVIGPYNHWGMNHHELKNVGNGFWEGEFENIGAGDSYKYLIHKHNGKSQHRIDPAARDTVDSQVNNSRNHAIVVDPAFDWEPFISPSFDQLIIYQCHIGSFSGRNDGLQRTERTATFNDAIKKLDYVKKLGFTAIELLPIQEFEADRSLGYNPSFYFSPEAAYGKPGDLRVFVNECHKRGLAVIFDVVFNHISNIDSSFWHFDDEDASSYLTSGETPWGLSPAFWEEGIKGFFLENLKMYIEEYKADGIRFDSTKTILEKEGLGEDGLQFLQYLTYLVKEKYPDKYLVAEQIPAGDNIINQVGFHATWFDEAYYLVLDALQGYNPVDNIISSLGLDFGYGKNFSETWNLVKYLTGSHDKIGDLQEGKEGHCYFVEKFGGRSNWYARAKTRMGWALNIALQGTPMLFMGTECHSRGYWHDSIDSLGDHRFDWSLTNDNDGIAMQKMVAMANYVRNTHPALRQGPLEITHEDYLNSVIAFKRWNNDGDLVLVVINAGDTDFIDHTYGLQTKQPGKYQQIFCSQDAIFGGWDGAGNAFYDPETRDGEYIYINIPKWSVSMFKLL